MGRGQGWNRSGRRDWGGQGLNRRGRRGRKDWGGQGLNRRGRRGRRDCVFGLLMGFLIHLLSAIPEVFGFLLLVGDFLGGTRFDDDLEIKEDLGDHAQKCQHQDPCHPL